MSLFAADSRSESWARTDSFAAELESKGISLSRLEEVDDAAVAEAEAHEKKLAQEEAEHKLQFLQVESMSFCLYLFLVGLLTATLRFSRYGQLDYYFSEMIREAVLESEVHATADKQLATTFMEITSFDDVYAFLHGPLLAALYVATTYDGKPLPPDALNRVNEHNILVGKVRLQQVRGKRGNCLDRETAVDALQCEEDSNLDEDDRSTIVGADPTLTNPACFPATATTEAGSLHGTPSCQPNEYPWLDATASGIGTFAGWHKNYDGSGYPVLLPSDSAAAHHTINTLRADGYLGPKTRAFWVDFSLYNANINRFCLVRFLFERLPSGTLAPSDTIRTYNLLWYDQGGGLSTRLVSEVGLLVIVLFFIFLELYSMRKRGLKAYWNDPSNWYDWPSLLGFGVAGFLRYKAWGAMNDLKINLDLTMNNIGADEDPLWDATNTISELAQRRLDQPVNFHEVKWWVDHEQMVLAVDAVMVYLKILHFMANVPYISNLLSTLVRARIQLYSFILVLSILVMAFATAFHLALGSQLGAWRGIGHSVLSLLRFVLGEVDVESLRASNPALGTTLYVAFNFVVVLIAVTIFLTIVTEAYTNERKFAPEVNLPKIVYNAAGRQYVRFVEGRKRLLKKLGRKLAGRPDEDEEDEKAESDALSDALSRTTSQRRDSKAPSLGSNPDDANLTEEQRQKKMVEHIAKAREALEGGHNFVLNEVRVSLKSMCFRQDGSGQGGGEHVPNVRGPLQVALAELEKHSALNDALRARALKANWVWDLSSGQLHKSLARGKVEGDKDADDADASRMAQAEDKEAAQEAMAHAARALALGGANQYRGLDEAPTEGFQPSELEERVRRRFEARGEGVATTEAEVHAADGDPNAFSLQRAIAFTRAMAVGADGGGGGKAAGKAATAPPPPQQQAAASPEKQKERTGTRHRHKHKHYHTKEK